MKDKILKFYDYDQKLVMQYTLGRNMTFKMNVETTDTQCLSVISVVRESEM